ncbi:DUF4129 domain-containing transglutaminase family protein [Edaphobacillus lindanitolerans]|uniref:Transglutaminase-like domain-containing protein n=1 Tax=Edaphobacillus lindanitolerans TaxID=550447 RepID=A0A1U7PTK2_9BACI|nr:transglutaminase domain-containing protein [Edaphobacillus lindanitolerans]SIT92808.1 protein of unknown function [Edaphobacillus lindanitolerans]
MNGKWQKRLFLAVIYTLVFLLVREWLIPIAKLTGTGHLGLFLIFVGLCFALPLAGTPRWLSASLKVVFSAWFITRAYLEGPTGIGAVLRFFAEEFRVNTQALLSGDFAGITDSFRTVLFLALIWMASYLIQFWIETRMSVLLFYGMTLIFITVLDTFSPYRADAAILRILVIGLLLVGLLSLAKLASGQSRMPSLPSAVLMAVPLVLIVGVSGALSQMLPKSEPAWPDPVPFLRSLADGAGSGGPGEAGKIGYGEDDSMLGGPFIGDNTVVFQANVKSGQYWKVETKDTYTMRGWVNSAEEQELIPVGNGTPIADPLLAGKSRDEDTAELTMTHDFKFIVQPYGAQEPAPVEGVQFLKESVTGKVVPFRDRAPVSLERYSVSYSEPAYSLTALRQTMPDKLPESGFERYLQLPDELPQRVRDLAAELTENEPTLYGKARSVERYFSQNGYVYDQLNVASPGAGDDYVDHFLFDSKRGYCDNFSTSMVVLLRSAGIPARWVKGFSEGEDTGRKGETRRFEITNNNAHSWVEAYMPGVGWMPFEPTVGFNGAGGIDYDLNIDDQPEEQQETPEQAEKPEQQKEEKQAAAAGSDFWKSAGEFFSNHRNFFYGAAAVLLAAAVFAWLTRSKWLPKYLVARYRRRQFDREGFERAYGRLLKQLRKYGLTRADGKTLSDYADEVDAHFGGTDMRRLTGAYEENLYGGRETVPRADSLRESWENLIYRTGG